MMGSMRIFTVHGNIFLDHNKPGNVPSPLKTSAYPSNIFSFVSGDLLTLFGLMECIVTGDFLTLVSMECLPCFVCDSCGSSFPVTVKQVCKTSILKDASLESRLGVEFAFVT